MGIYRRVYTDGAANHQCRGGHPGGAVWWEGDQSLSRSFTLRGPNSYITAETGALLVALSDIYAFRKGHFELHTDYYPAYKLACRATQEPEFTLDSFEMHGYQREQFPVLYKKIMECPEAITVHWIHLRSMDYGNREAHFMCRQAMIPPSRDHLSYKHYRVTGVKDPFQIY